MGRWLADRERHSALFKVYTVNLAVALLKSTFSELSLAI